MTETEAQGQPSGVKTEAVVQCAKCEQVNRAGSNKCGFCGAHLYVSCYRCGHSNQRAFVRCTHCGERLHRSFWRRWRKKLFPERSKVTPLSMAVLVVAVLAAYFIIVKLTNVPVAPPQ